jgi:hypothetical protein
MTLKHQDTKPPSAEHKNLNFNEILLVDFCVLKFWWQKSN